MQVNKKYLNNSLRNIILKPLYNERENLKRKKLIKLLKSVLLYQYENCKEYKNRQKKQENKTRKKIK